MYQCVQQIKETSQQIGVLHACQVVEDTLHVVGHLNIDGIWQGFEHALLTMKLTWQGVGCHPLNHGESIWPNLDS